MLPKEEIEAVLDFLHEPIFILSTAGVVLRSNAAAEQLTGVCLVGRNIAEMISSSESEFRSFLRRCSGTTAPTVGSLAIVGSDGNALNLRVYGARLRGQGEAVRLALRCVPTATDKLSILTKKVRELNTEISERRRTQAALEETLEANEILLRELQHRVKNIIQLIISLFSTAQRESNSPDIKAFIVEANRRLLALGTTHNIMYQSQKMRAVPTRPFLTSLCSAIGTTLGPTVRIDVTSVGGELSNETAFPIALIVNELVTNAFKHGLKDGGGVIQVHLERDGQDYKLMIRDNGPGFPSTVAERRAAGLGLVRGLCRQIGGTLQTENAGGARCLVRFSDMAHAKDGS